MVEPVEKTSLPDQVDVAVIGGGIVGICTALYLAEAGHSVVVCEKGIVGGEQSSRNWGWIRKAGRDKRELQLMIESARLWKDLVANLDDDIGYGQRGTTYLAATEAEFHKHEVWLKENAAFDHGAVLLDGQQTDALLNRNDRAFVGALHTPSDATAEPALAVPAITRLARKRGAIVLENCAVRSIERQAGRVSAIVTEHGEIRCQKVVLAGGAWSRTFLENMGIAFPQLAIKSSVLRTTPGPEVVSGAIGATDASLRRRADGGYTIAKSGAAEFEIVPAAFRYFFDFLPVIAERWRMMTLKFGPGFFGPMGRHRWSASDVTPFEQVRVMSPQPNMKLLTSVLNNAKRLHPRIAEVRVAEAWGGLIDTMPDEIPVIDEPAGWDGLLIASGLSGHGFGIGPGVAKLAVQKLTNNKALVDPSPFRLDRFGRRQAA
ncbi:FAD-binding oxidoreductase [Rhodobacterales bacterium]|nr:FAD-binding oxidoreductase [Rhodobacterales bacterium]